MKYICSNCGYLQNEIGISGGCAHTFWSWCIIITLLLSLIYWVGFIVLAFEILFFILTGGKSNCCHKCKAKDCVIPVNTPRGEKLFDEYYEEEIEEEQEELTGEIKTQSTDENDYTFTKIKIQKAKSWKDIIRENQITIIISTIGFLILWTIYLMLLPVVIPDDEKNIKQNNPIQKIEPQSNQKNITNVSKQITLETSPQLQAQYKVEIEKAINNGVIKTKKEIDKTYKEADEFYTNMISQENYSYENYEKYEGYSRILEGQVFGLYMELINITEKYTKHHEDLATDWYGKLAEYIEPTMKKYHVSNLNKLAELESDMAHKSNEIDIRAQGIFKMVYGNN